MTTRMPSQKTVQVTPTTRLGWWAVWLALASIPLTLAWSLLPLGAWWGFASGMAGGILALVAMNRDRERALTVFAALGPMLFVLWFLVMELLSAVGVLPPH